MSQSKWPEAFGVGAVALAAAVILTPWERIGPISWDAISAVGTVLAVFAAVLIPAWQNWDRKREQDGVQATLEWASAHDAARLVAELQLISDRWTGGESRPVDITMERLIGQIETTKARVTDILGSSILSDALSIALAIRENSELARTLTNHERLVVKIPGGLLEQWEARLPELSEFSTRWMERILARLRRLNLPVPGITISVNRVG